MTGHPLPTQRLTAAALRILAHPDPAQLDAARVGQVYPTGVLVPWSMLVELAEAVDDTHYAMALRNMQHVKHGRVSRGGTR